MAYVSKEWDLTLNRNKKGGDGQPTAIGKMYLNGSDRPFSLYRQDKVEGKQPTHYGYVDVGNDTRYKVSAWFAGTGKQTNNRPNINGWVTMGDWERPFAMWEMKGDDLWWAGQVEKDEDRKRAAYKPEGQSSQAEQKQVQQLNDGFADDLNTQSNNNAHFDLDDEIPF